MTKRIIIGMIRTKRRLNPYILETFGAFRSYTNIRLNNKFQTRSKNACNGFWFDYQLNILGVIIRLVKTKLMTSCEADITTFAINLTTH